MTAIFTSPVLFGVLLAWATPQASFANAPQDALNHYLRLQDALARDSMQNVSANAKADGADGEWQNREIADFNQFSGGRIWSGDDANQKPQAILKNLLITPKWSGF